MGMVDLPEASFHLSHSYLSGIMLQLYLQHYRLAVMLQMSFV
jgi:hypothetical protein